jgi:quercetin dioxygenase-like cupin family protein
MCSYESAPHNEGVEETLTVVDGTMMVTVGENDVNLEKGETLVFSGNQIHKYVNTTDILTVLHLIIHYKYV